LGEGHTLHYTEAGLGFRFRVEGSVQRFRDQGSGFEVGSGLGLRVQFRGLGIRVQGSRFRV